MISAGEFRNGVTFEQDGQVLQVVEFQHVKPGKGAAFVRTKTKNVITGSVVETSYNPTAKFPQAFIERKDVTYSYEDGDLYSHQSLVNQNHRGNISVNISTSIIKYIPSLRYSNVLFKRFHQSNSSCNYWCSHACSIT